MARYRTKSKDISLGVSSKYYNYTNDKVSYPSSQTWFNTATERRTMTDQVNPGYYRAAREGRILPVAPMSKTSEWSTLNPGTLRFSSPGPYGFRYDYDYFGSFSDGGFTVTAPAWPMYDQQVLLQQALARAQTDAWDTATFLAEFGKTVDSLTTFYGRWKLMYERIETAARNRRRRFHTFAQAFADAWLEARYSFRPLYYDMLSIQKAIQRMQNGIDSPLCRGWASATSGPSTSSKLTSRGNFTLSQITPGGPVRKDTFSSGGSITTDMQTCSRELEIRATVGVQVTTRATTMFDPAVTSWELIPFSFVFDWFITLGDAIAAFSPFATGAFKYATYSVIRRQTQTMMSVPTVNAPLVSRGSSPSTWTVVSESYSRVSAKVVPTLSFSVDLNASKIVDLVALMWQLKLRHIKLLK